MNRQSICPRVEDLENFWSRKIPKKTKSQVLDHISTCTECRALWNRMNMDYVDFDVEEIDKMTIMMVDNRNRRIAAREAAEYRKSITPLVAGLFVIIAISMIIIAIQLLR